MFGILLILLFTAASLALLFWVGSVFLQGYFYTQPSLNLHWQAPAAGVVLASFFTAWCLLIALSAKASPTDIPYDTLFRFSPQVEMVSEPVKELWAVPKKGAPIRFKREHVFDPLASGKYMYKEATLAQRRWDTSVEAILVEHNGERIRFTRGKAGEGDYSTFVSESGGWEMREYDSGPSGKPVAFRLGRFLVNLFLNGFHLVLWFVCLWLIVRFSIAHSLLLSFSLWLVMTLVVLPILFTYSAEVAVRRRPPPTPPGGQTRLVRPVHMQAVGRPAL